MYPLEPLQFPPQGCDVTDIAELKYRFSAGICHKGSVSSEYFVLPQFPSRSLINLEYRVGA